MAEPIEAGVTHDIVIEVGGVQYGFMLDRRNPYGLQDSNRAIPNVPNTPGILQEYGVLSVDAQDSWLHGFGHGFARDNEGFEQAEGLETRLPGFIQLATKFGIYKEFSTYQTIFQSRRIAEYLAASGYWHIAVGKYQGIADYTGSGWNEFSDPDGDTDPEVVPDLLACDGFVLLAMLTTDSTDERLYKYDGAAFSAAGSGSNPPNNFFRLEKGGGYLWGSEYLTNLLHRDATDDASAFEGGASDPNVIKVGGSDSPIISLCWWRDNLRVGKGDALYFIDRNFVPRTEISDFVRARGPRSHYGADPNFDHMAVGPGGLWFTVPGKIYRWTGNVNVDMTPPTYGIEPPYNRWTRFRYLHRFNEHMYVVADDPNNDRWMLCYSNGRWHMLYKMVASGGGDVDVWAVGHSEKYGKLMWALNQDDGGYKSRIRAFTVSGWTFPYPEFDTATYRYIYSARYDFNSQVISKSFWEFTARVNNVTATGRDVSLHYRIDDTGDWISISTLTIDGLHELLFSMPPPKGKWIQFRVGLRTNSASQTPYLDTWGVKGVARPETTWATRYNVLVGDGIKRRDGKFDKRSPQESLQAIMEAREDEDPVIVYDFWQGKQYGYVTYVRVAGLQFIENMDTLPKKGGAVASAQIVFQPLRAG